MRKDGLDDIYNLYQRIPEQKMNSIFITELANILLQKGNSNWSKELGQKALKMSSASGWIEHYDGGSRLKSIELLQKINSGDFGLQSLLSDLGSGNAPIRDIALNLPKIFDTLDQEFSYKSGWLILKEFLKANLVYCEVIPIEKELVITKERHIDALLNWLFKFLDYPSSDLLQHIETTLLDLISENEEIIYFIEKNLANYNSNIQLRILQLLFALSVLKKSDYSFKLEGEFHSDFRIQFLLSKILKKQFSGLTQKKSAYYYLDVPDITDSDFSLNEYHSIIETNFNSQINFLIDTTNLEAEKINNRIYLFAAKENVFDKYTIGQTNELEKDNRGNRIDLNHYSLDFLLIQAAIYKLIYELFQNGLLNEFHLPTINANNPN